LTPRYSRNPISHSFHTTGCVCLHTFYVENGELSLEDARHAFRVLRLKPGDDVIALARGARWTARIAEISEKNGSVELMAELPANEARAEITVYQGLPKAEKLELLSQKLTELGVSRLVPVRMARSVAKLEGTSRVERLNKIAREAVKQCGRTRPMEILPPMDWNSALSDMRSKELMLAPWELSQPMRMADVHRQVPTAREIGILIGPEGGMEEAEVCASGARQVSLGPRILRAETAALAAAALAMAYWGDI
jgi:16S rRNA (uracil1498-N3)-methyltransferase